MTVMRKPTDTRDLYPSGVTDLDRLIDERIDRLAAWIFPALATLAAVGVATLGMDAYHHFFN